MSERPVIFRWVPGLLLLMYCAAILNTELYVPAISLIAKELNVSTALIQALVGHTILTQGLSSLFFGPLSDHVGRRPVMLLGLALMLLGSALSLWPTYEALLVGRVIQGLGGGAVFGLSMAVLVDVFSPKEAARAMAYISMAIVLSPAVGQVGGGYLAEHYGWHSCLVAAALLTVIVAALQYFFMPETLSADKRSKHSAGHVLQEVWGILRTKGGTILIFVHPLFFFGFWVFRTVTPVTFIELYDISVSDYGYYTVLVVLMQLAGAWYVQRALKFHSLDYLLRQVMVAGLVAVGALCCSLAAGPRYFPLLITLGGAIYSGAMTMSFSTSVNRAMPFFKVSAGAASGVIGCVRTLFATGGTYLAAVLTDENEAYLVGVMVIFSLLAIFAIRQGLRVAMPHTSHA